MRTWAETARGDLSKVWMWEVKICLKLQSVLETKFWSPGWGSGMKRFLHHQCIWQKAQCEILCWTHPVHDAATGWCLLMPWRSENAVNIWLQPWLWHSQVFYQRCCVCKIQVHDSHVLEHCTLDCCISLWCTTTETGGQGEALLWQKIISHGDVMKLETLQLGKFGSSKSGGSSRSACDCPENVSYDKTFASSKVAFEVTFSNNSIHLWQDKG